MTINIPPFLSHVLYLFVVRPALFVIDRCGYAAASKEEMLCFLRIAAHARVYALTERETDGRRLQFAALRWKGDNYELWKLGQIPEDLGLPLPPCEGCESHDGFANDDGKDEEP